MSSSAPFSLHPATAADIPALASLAAKKGQPDRHTQLKAHPRYGGYEHAAVMTEPLTSWIGSPAIQRRVVKAVDDQTGEILGWVCWGMRGYSDADPPRMSVSGRSKGSGKTGLARMEELTSADLVRWMETLMPEGTKCLFVASIVVSPEHQHRGIGSALVRDGTLQADRDGVFCWVHASENGAGFFAREGFHEIGRLDVNLDEFAAEEEAMIKESQSGVEVEAAAEGMWGVYQFKYMQRLPQSISS